MLLDGREITLVRGIPEGISLEDRARMISRWLYRFALKAGIPV